MSDYKWSKTPLLGQDNNSLVMLLALNGIVFIIITFIRLVYTLGYDSNIIAEGFFQNQILNWFQLPATFEKLITRPWTLVIYMFTHYKVWHLVGNMLWLFGFGFILQDLAGNNKLIPVYLYGGFLGGIVFLLSINFLPFLYTQLPNIPPFIGAGAALMAVAVATTALAPDYRIFPMLNGGIPLWILTVLFVAFDFASVASQNGGVALAHITGGLAGFIYIKQLQRGRDGGQWMYQFVDWLNNLFNPEKKGGKNAIKNKQFYEKGKQPFKKIPNVTQRQVDELLDKINQQGYHMLTDEEKAFLRRVKDEL